MFWRDLAGAIGESPRRIRVDAAESLAGFDHLQEMPDAVGRRSDGHQSVHAIARDALTVWA
jgi:hypothetical protein